MQELISNPLFNLDASFTPQVISEYEVETIQSAYHDMPTTFSTLVQELEAAHRTDLIMAFDYNSYSMLHTAAAAGFADIVKMLIERFDIPVNYSQEIGKLTPLSAMINRTTDRRVLCTFSGYRGYE